VNIVGLNGMVEEKARKRESEKEKNRDS
jgi:hypothetical protein